MNYKSTYKSKVLLLLLYILKFENNGKVDQI